MRYFYNKETGEYMGATSESGTVPKGCGETSERPDAGRNWNGIAWTNGGQEKQAKPRPKLARKTYAAKVAAYTDRQLQAGMMRAKGQKLEILKAERASRGLS